MYTLCRQLCAYCAELMLSSHAWGTYNPIHSLPSHKKVASIRVSICSIVHQTHIQPGVDMSIAHMLQYNTSCSACILRTSIYGQYASISVCVHLRHSMRSLCKSCYPVHCRRRASMQRHPPVMPRPCALADVVLEAPSLLDFLPHECWPALSAACSDSWSMASPK